MSGVIRTHAKLVSLKLANATMRAASVGWMIVAVGAASVGSLGIGSLGVFGVAIAIATPAQARCFVGGTMREDIADRYCEEAKRTGCVRAMLTTPEYRACLRAQRVQAPSSPISPKPQAPTSRDSEWSGLSRAAGVEYRYRWSWSAQSSGHVKAIFEVRNLQNRRWQGSARSVDCSNGTLSRDASVDLQPKQKREVSFITPNCGTPEKPSFRPHIAKSKSY